MTWGFHVEEPAAKSSANLESPLERGEAGSRPPCGTSGISQNSISLLLR